MLPSWTYYDVSTALILVLTSSLVVFFMIMSSRAKSFPPGPVGIPFLGYIPFVGSNIGETMTKLKSKYGAIFSVRMGAEDWVMLNDYGLINEAFVKQSDKFSGRPSIFFLQKANLGDGIIFTDYGHTWKCFRKFGQSTLRGFGVGKKSMEKNILEESGFLIENLASDTGEDLHTKMTKGITNVICRILFGSRYSDDDKRFLLLVQEIKNISSDSIKNKLGGLMMLCPSLRHLPYFGGIIKLRMKQRVEHRSLLQGIINEHKETFDKNHIRDFIDAFLSDIEAEKDPSFREKNLLKFVEDLFDAGSSTTIGTLMWCFLAIAYFPAAQDKIAHEVDEVLGESGIASMTHRDLMPYTRAFIHEIFRHRTLVPLGVFHKTTEDCVLRGYKIPKNTTVNANLWAVHHDPELYTDPELFQPERFLNEEGRFVKPEYFIPFSIGPRYCMGESLARMEVFIFLVSITQKLRVKRNPDSPLPPFENGCFNGVSYDPLKFDLLFEKR